jgi:GalNAc5-diNAcBac-PP-undecaprenol beta-1,3-glucosyltransferase
MTSTPFFTVVIPSYNRAALLGDVLQSVQAQTFQDFEVILVDDGSTDETAAVVQKLAAADPRIRYQYQQNAERGAARNTGIKAAKGDFVVFFDSDDEMKPDYLQVLHTGIQAQPGYALYAARYLFLINGTEKPSGITGIPAGEHGLELLLQGNFFSCNFCIRRAHPGLVLFEEDRTLATMEDWMFLVENLQGGEKIYLFDPVGVLMHEHEGRSMQQNELLITRRLGAMERLLRKHHFTPADQKKLRAYSYYFCSVHAYLDTNDRKALSYLAKAVKNAGLNPLFLKAGLKYLIGRSVIVWLKEKKKS